MRFLFAITTIAAELILPPLAKATSTDSSGTIRYEV